MRSTPLAIWLAVPLTAQVVGTWRVASQPNLSVLIDQATAAMKPGERSHARELLKKNTTAFKQVTITHGAGQITIQYGDEQRQCMPDDALAVPWSRGDGQKYLVSGRFEGTTLIQTLLGEEGMRETAFHERRDLLTMNVTVKAMMLPKPFRYTLTYRH